MRLLLLLVLSMVPLSAAAQAAEPAELQAMRLDEFPRGQLQILRGPVRHRFDIWVADTPLQQQRGLMFERELAADRGMLFPHAQPRVLSMWMRNTLIELDMIFIDEHGRIIYIKQRAKPHSEEIISTPLPAKAVLEIKGGETKRLGIVVGDRIVYPVASSARPRAAPSR